MLVKLVIVQLAENMVLVITVLENGLKNKYRLEFPDDMGAHVPRLAKNLCKVFGRFRLSPSPQ